MPAAKEWFRQAFDDLYLTIYARRNVDEAERIAAWLAPLVDAGGARVLDLACGAGRFFTPLATQGAAYVGLDLSRPLLEEAVRQHAVADRRPLLIRADMRSVPIRAGAVDAVLSIFTSFGYFANEDEEKIVIGEIADLLVSGGRFAVDLMNPDHVHRTLVPEGERRAAGYRIHESRCLHGDTVVKEIRVTNDGGEHVRDYQERVRLIPLDALTAWCEERGLTRRWIRGDYDGGAYDPDTSPRMIVGFVKEER